MKNNAATRSIALVLATAMGLASHARAGDLEDLKEEVARLKDRLDSGSGLQAGSFPGSYRVGGSDTSVKLGGFINVTYNQDLGPALDRKNLESFSVPAIPVTTPGRDRKGQAFFDARYSRISLETRTPAAGSEVRTLIEYDFWSYNNQGSDAQLNPSSSRFRQAFLQWGPWLAGQTWTTFIDLDALPDTIDWGGPSGALTVRQPQLRYTRSVREAHTLAVSLEHARTDITYSDDRSFSGNLYHSNRRARDRRPDLIAKYKFKRPRGHASAALVWRELRWEDPADGGTRSRQVLGLGIGGAWKIGDRGTYVFASASGGSALGRYMGELYNEGDSGTYDTVRREFRPTRALGGQLGVTCYWTSALRSTLALGQTQLTDHPAQANSYDQIPDRRYRTLHLNVIYSPFARMDLGAEFIHGERETATGLSQDASRVTLGVRYSY